MSCRLISKYLTKYLPAYYLTNIHIYLGVMNQKKYHRFPTTAYVIN